MVKGNNVLKFGSRGKKSDSSDRENENSKDSIEGSPDYVSASSLDVGEYFWDVDLSGIEFVDDNVFGIGPDCVTLEDELWNWSKKIEKLLDGYEGGPSNKNTIATMQKTVDNYTPEELLEVMSEATESKVGIHRAFYYVLMMKARGSDTLDF
ncbi:hypothetical protein KC865_00675 [Candidatus Kaiserbacteria bacterium]|nr:hypothetical protein [Candidatus Kaiserbacteria bacterium]